jgi:hypothetical protein
VSDVLCSALAGKQPDEVTHVAKPASENFLLPDRTLALARPHAASLLTENNGFALTLRPSCGPRPGGEQTLTLKTPDRQHRSPFFYAKSQNLFFCVTLPGRVGGGCISGKTADRGPAPHSLRDFFLLASILTYASRIVP